MKNVKKVLGLVLALAMVLSICSTMAFAAVPAGKYCAVTVTPTAANYSKGDKVTFNVNVQTAEGVGAVDRCFSFIMLYNSNVFELCSTEQGLDKHGFVAGTVIGDNIDMSSSCLFDAADLMPTYPESNPDGWDKAFCIQVYPNDETGMDLTSGTDLFKFDLKLKDDVADGEYKIIYSTEDSMQGTCFFNPQNGDDYGEYFYDPAYYEAPITTVTVGAAATPVIKASKTGDVVNTLVGWGNYDPKTDTCDGAKNGLFNIAVKATFTAEDLAEAGLTFDEKGTCAEIASLTATVQIGTYNRITAETKYIYGAANGKGAYEYYVVITNIPYGATDIAEVTFGGTLTEAAGGGDITGETVTIDFAEAFNAAVDRGLPTKGYIGA